MKKHYRHEHDCLNCGSELQGKYCHNCGQENLEIKESFGHMMNHAISDYFHFDHQFFHTLKPLLLKPGQLTIEYMKGRRAQYLHPVKMYIFISLIYFVLIFRTNHEVVKVDRHQKQDNQETAAKVKEALDKDSSMTPEQKKKIADRVNTGLNLVGVKPSKTHTKTYRRTNSLSPINVNVDDDDKDDKDEDSTVAAYHINQQKLPAGERDGFWERMFREKSISYKERYGDRAKDEFMDEVKHNIPKMMFVLLPLFALILRIMFRKNRKYYVEHLIYSIHLHSFYFLFSAIILLIQMCLPDSWGTVSGWLTTILCLYTLYYIYRSLRVLYQRSRWATIRKMIGMSFLYWTAFIICMVGLVTVIAAMN